MGSILEQLNIEPGALLVNIVGFLVLLWIIKRYAMGPISEFMQQRSEQIREKIEDADAMKASAAAERDNLQDELEQMRQEVRQELRANREAATEQIEQMQAEAQKERERIIESGEQELERAREEMMAEVEQIAMNMAVDVAKKVVRDALDQQRRDAITQSIINDINALADEESHT